MWPYSTCISCSNLFVVHVNSRLYVNVNHIFDSYWSYVSQFQCSLFTAINVLAHQCCFFFSWVTSPSCSPGLQSLWAETTWWHPSGPWGVRDLHHNRDLVWVFFISIALITDVIIKSCNAALVLTILYDRVKQHHKLRI